MNRKLVLMQLLFAIGMSIPFFFMVVNYGSKVHRTYHVVPAGVEILDPVLSDEVLDVNLLDKGFSLDDIDYSNQKEVEESVTIGDSYAYQESTQL